MGSTTGGLFYVNLHNVMQSRPLKDMKTLSRLLVPHPSPGLGLRDEKTTDISGYLMVSPSVPLATISHNSPVRVGHLATHFRQLISATPGLWLAVGGRRRKHETTRPDSPTLGPQERGDGRKEARVSEGRCEAVCFPPAIRSGRSSLRFTARLGTQCETTTTTTTIILGFALELIAPIFFFLLPPSSSLDPPDPDTLFSASFAE